MMPANEHVEVHNAYPPSDRWQKSTSPSHFILEHPREVEAYLEDQDRIFEEIKAHEPMPVT